VSPFGGRAKLVWNVDWAARWGLVGATIEGCGKDLATAGGSRDRADAISRRVFEREPPLNIPYEFLNIGGKKMSTSKGTGAAAHEVAALLPPTQLRFLFLRHRPNRALDFDPTGDTLPRLFDDFDRIADSVAGKPTRGELPPDPERIFALSLADPAADPATVAAQYRPPFGHLALLLQVPGTDVRERLDTEKGSPLDAAEQAVASERIAAAQLWLEDFAPDSARFAIATDGLPAAATDLTADQKRYLGLLAGAARADTPANGEAWQALIFEIAKGNGFAPADAFAALYLAFMGRANGPRAGWLLASLDPVFVIGRLEEAAK
jgi:lysyl-tRNA synthetase class 1